MLEKVRDKQTEGKSGMDSEIQKQSKKDRRPEAFQYAESLFYLFKLQNGSHSAQRATVHYIKSWKAII